MHQERYSESREPTTKIRRPIGAIYINVEQGFYSSISELAVIRNDYPYSMAPICDLQS